MQRVQMNFKPRKHNGKNQTKAGGSDVVTSLQFRKSTTSQLSGASHADGIPIPTSPSKHQARELQLVDKYTRIKTKRDSRK